MQLLVIQFTIKMFHIGFVQVFILQSLKSQYYEIIKALKLSYFTIKWAKNLFVATILMKSICVVAVYEVFMLVLMF